MVEVHESVEAIGADWDALADRTNASPFVRPGWISAWLRGFGANGAERLVAVRRGSHLVGVLPLMRRRGALVSPTNWHTPQFDAVAEDDEAVAELAAAALSLGGRRLDLSFLNPGSPLLERLSVQTRGSRAHLAGRIVARSPFVPIDSDWAQFESSLPSRRRSKHRRTRRRLEEQGQLSAVLERGDSDLEHLLEMIFQMEALGWKGRRGTAIASQPKTLAFYHEVAQWAAARGSLALWFLNLDGRPIAFALGLVEAGVYYDLKVGFDPSWARFGPGVLLIEARLKHAFDAGLERFEFLGQDERHKLDWTDACHDMTRVQVFRATPAGLASRLAWTYGRPVAQRALATLRRSD